MTTMTKNVFVFLRRYNKSIASSSGFSRRMFHHYDSKLRLDPSLRLDSSVRCNSPAVASPVRFHGSSSSTALVEDDYDDDDDFSSSTINNVLVTTTTNNNNNINNRPRLQALRRRLQREKQQEQEQAAAAKASLAAAVEDDNDDELHDPSLIPFSIPNHFLKDRFGRRHSYLRISLVERCNLRCSYCMPPEGLKELSEDILTVDEIATLARAFIDAGVNKIKLTGGEPLLRKGDLIHLISELSPLVKDIGMTTNAVTLSRYWKDLVTAGLTSINISLDTLHASKFERLTKRPYFEKVYNSLETALHDETFSGRIKVNCVVMRNINDDELSNFVELTKQYPNLDVRFIEWMPFSQNGWNANTLVTHDEMMTTILRDYPMLMQCESLNPNDTTKWYRLNDNNSGRVGFITSMSNHFCGTCNRLRLTADGKLKACLFGKEEIDLKHALRENSSDLPNLIRTSVMGKHYKLGGHASPQDISDRSHSNRPMTMIGG